MNEWQDRFEDVEAFWIHDLNPKRPYVRLASRKISNVYFNGGFIASEFPSLHGQASYALVERARGVLGRDTAWRAIGPAKGAICLSYDIAVMGGYRHAWADKEGDGFAIDPRFTNHFRPDEGFILVEDTITSGGSIRKVRSAIVECVPEAMFAPFVLALCNRSGKKRLPSGEDIISLIEPDARIWDEGDNPFTADGQEMVQPVSGKTQWHELTRAYD